MTVQLTEKQQSADVKKPQNNFGVDNWFPFATPKQTATVFAPSLKSILYQMNLIVIT